MRSMTGFGKGSATGAGVCFNIEISAVNRRQLDIRVGMPNGLAAFEPLLRRLMGQHVSRGSLQVRVDFSQENSGDIPARINQPLLDKMIEVALTLKQKYDLPGEISPTSLMVVPGVVEAVAPDVDREDVRLVFSRALELALDALNKTREQEGLNLLNDLSDRLNNLEKLVERLEPLTDAIPGQLKEKMLERLTREGLSVDTADERVVKEMVIFADKSDATEEITRLRSHFGQFRQFCKNDSVVGRGLDFLTQEMLREINTLGNKAGGGEITPLVVEFKTELEKIREQVQNIE